MGAQPVSQHHQASEMVLEGFCYWNRLNFFFESGWKSVADGQKQFPQSIHRIEIVARPPIFGRRVATQTNPIIYGKRRPAVMGNGRQKKTKNRLGAIDPTGQPVTFEDPIKFCGKRRIKKQGQSLPDMACGYARLQVLLCLKPQLHLPKSWVKANTPIRSSCLEVRLFSAAWFKARWMDGNSQSCLKTIATSRQWSTSAKLSIILPFLFPALASPRIGSLETPLRGDLNEQIYHVDHPLFQVRSDAKYSVAMFKAVFLLTFWINFYYECAIMYIKRFNT